jgi:hypothetical protein
MAGNKLIDDVREAVVIAEALRQMMNRLMTDKDKYDPKLLQDTIKYLNMVRIKYYKQALFRMRANENGDLEMMNNN